MASGNITKETIKSTYQITTVNNAYVSPFSAYAQLGSIGIGGYDIASATLRGGSSTSTGVASIVNDDTIKVVTNVAGDYQVVVLYTAK